MSVRVTTQPPLPLHNYLLPAEARSVVHARPPAKRRAVSIAREPIQDHTSTRARTFHRHAPSLEIQRNICRLCLLAADTPLVLHNKSGHERAPFQLTRASLMECTARPPAHISRFHSDPTFTQRAAVLLLERLSVLSTPTRQRPTECSILGLAWRGRQPARADSGHRRRSVAKTSARASRTKGRVQRTDALALPPALTRAGACRFGRLLCMAARAPLRRQRAGGCAAAHTARAAWLPLAPPARGAGVGGVGSSWILASPPPPPPPPPVPWAGHIGNSSTGAPPPLPCASMRDRPHASGCSTVCDLPPHPCSPYIPRPFTVNPGYHPHVPRP